VDGDELFSRYVAMQPALSAFEAVRNDLVHPPLYYALLKADVSICGASLLGVRALSLLCGIASVGLVALLGRRLPGARWCGFLAGAGVALGRFHVFYSMEARSYALYTMLVILLLLWVDSISRRQRDPRLWLAGFCLMTMLVYTHYYGSLYMIAVVLSLLVCSLELRTKLLAVGASAAAALLFTPWLYAVSDVYKMKLGLSSNLDWQGLPSLRDLKQVWAWSLGLVYFPWGTTTALLLIATLGGAALFLVSSKETLRRSPAVVALVIAGVFPPLVVFILAGPPFNLPIFALRHFLPSTAALLLLCCFGLERLSQSSMRRAPLVALCGAPLLLFFAAAPTIMALRTGPLHFPYDVVEQRVGASWRGGVQAFAADFHEEGETVNYYCKGACVQPLPENEAQLPPRLLLLYKPSVAIEENWYRQLIQGGYVDTGHALYTHGYPFPYGVMAANLERQK
jgi:4-amino-4-deoxy-L-arabinose transferase-like glycosyltransferase